MNTSLILTVLGIHLLAVISPGPDLIVCLRNTMQRGRKMGIYTALGFGMGIGVHIIYCSLGLAAIINQSIQLFTGIKTAGALYLLYMGRRSFVCTGASVEQAITESKTSLGEKSPISALWDGFLTNVLNPKATLFFLSLFTFVIGPDTSLSTLLTISSMMIVNTALWFSLVAVGATHRTWRKKLDRYQGVINKTFGGVLILLGLKVLTTSNK